MSFYDPLMDCISAHVGGEEQKNNHILSILFWEPAIMGDQPCLVIPERLVASQE